MPAKETITEPKSNNAANTSPTIPDESRDIKLHLEYPEVIAFALTAAVVAFVGAIVVLSIPYAILSVPLPASVNRIGLSVQFTQALFFGRVWILLVPSLLFAAWTGYKFYRWGQNGSHSQ